MDTSRFSALRIALLFAVIVLVSHADMRAAGVIDTTFGANGTVVTTLSGYEDVEDVLFHPNGKFTLILSKNFYGFARFNADGSTDMTFGTNGVVRAVLQSTRITSAKLLSNGKMIVAGGAPSPNGQSILDFFIARHNNDGSLDTSFGNGGYFYLNQGQGDFFSAVEVQPDGKIVASGSHDDGGPTGAVMRLTANGQLDPSFGGTGFVFIPAPPASPYVVSNQVFTDLVLMDDGSVVVSSFQEMSLPGPDFNYLIDLIKLNSSGSPETTFGTDGKIRFSQLVGGRSPYSAAFIEKVNNKIFVSTGTGARWLNADGTQLKYFVFGGGKTSVIPNGRILSSGGRQGYIKVYSEDAFVGSATNNILGYVNEAGRKAYAQTDGKILMISKGFSGSAIYLQRLDRVTSQANPIVDFDSDDRSDYGFQRPDGYVGVSMSGSGEFYRFTNPGSKVIPEYDEFTTGTAFTFTNLLISWNPGGGSTSSTYTAVKPGSTYVFTSQWGLPTDIATGGDFNGTGRTDYTVFRPSSGVWYSLFGPTVQWGTAGDKPVPADYDYDGKTDHAIYRPSTGEWWVLKSSGGYFAVKFGIASDIPVTGDYDGDGFADISVYRPSEGNWYQYLTTAGFRVVRFGLPNDYPVPGDYDGDGRHDVAVYRDGQWHLLQSTDGYRVVNWGQPGDKAVASRYDE